MIGLFEIKHRSSGAVLFSAEADSVKAVVDAAVRGGVNLRGADLSYANLSYASLRGARLSYANLRGADLSDADLSYANLRGADLSYANLSYASLRGARLSYADLSYANLRGADLSYANLSYASLRGADLRGVKYRDSEIASAPVSIAGLAWDVLIIAGYIRIGCQEHTVQEWRDFSDDEIFRMDPMALEFWKANKARILAMAEEYQR